MKYKLHYSLLNKQGEKLENAGTSAVIEEDYLSIDVPQGEAFFIPFRDIMAVDSVDYSIQLSINGDNKLVISNLGYQFETFYKNLIAGRNEIILQDLLMYESLRKAGYAGDVLNTDQSEEEVLYANCELRLYETALVMLPENGELVRIPYSEIADLKAEDYKISLETEYDGRLVISRMGRQFEPFVRELNAALNELSLKVQQTLKELIHNLNPLTMRQAAALLKEGKAAVRVDLDAIDPALWREMEKQLESAGIFYEYNFLASMARKGKVCMGIKKGLMGDLTGLYTWFLAPIYSSDPGDGGNAVAVEAASKEGGRATYFFRITGRDHYRELKSVEELDQLADPFIKELNRCMQLINFRREPIYLTDEQLTEARYSRYRYAVKKIPALQLLRNHFIGRVFHYNDEQWAKDVLDLLRFNVHAKNDNLRWNKGSEE